MDATEQPQLAQEPIYPDGAAGKSKLFFIISSCVCLVFAALFAGISIYMAVIRAAPDAAAPTPEQVKVLQDETNRLVQAVAAVEQRAQAAKQELEKERRKKVESETQLTTQVQELQSQTNRLFGELSKAEGRAATSEAKAERAKQERAETMKEKGQLAGELTNALAQIKKLKEGGPNAELQTELEALRAKTNELRVVLEQARSAEASNAVLQGEIKLFRDQTNVLTVAAASALQKAQSLQIELDRANAKIGDLTRDGVTTQALIKALRDETNRLNQAMAAAEIRAQAAEQELEKERRKKDEFANQVQELQSHTNRLHDSLSKTEERLATTEAQAKEAQRQLVEVVEKKNKLEIEFKTAQEKNAATEEKLALERRMVIRLKDSEERINKLLSLYEDKNKQLEAAIKAKEDQLTTNLTEFSNLSNQLQKAVGSYVVMSNNWMGELENHGKTRVRLIGLEKAFQADPAFRERWLSIRLLGKMQKQIPKQEVILRFPKMAGERPIFQILGKTEFTFDIVVNANSLNDTNLYWCYYEAGVTNLPREGVDENGKAKAYATNIEFASDAFIISKISSNAIHSFTQTVDLTPEARTDLKKQFELKTMAREVTVHAALYQIIPQADPNQWITNRIGDGTRRFDIFISR